MTIPINQKTKKKMGRKPLEIDEKLVFDLAKIHCTYNEIASVCQCSVLTLSRRFDALIKRGYEESKSSLRRQMFKVAERGNVSMMIWLSKQHLGFRDKQPDEVAAVSFNITINEVPK